MKPLARGWMLKLRDQLIWISFKYEKISKICFQCGIIWHGNAGCQKKFLGRPRGDASEYGPWLRVESTKKKWNDKRRGTRGGDFRSQEA
jgi:hypothetical protein